MDEHCPIRQPVHPQPPPALLHEYKQTLTNPPPPVFSITLGEFSACLGESGAYLGESSACLGESGACLGGSGACLGGLVHVASSLHFNFPLWYLASNTKPVLTKDQGLILSRLS